VDVNYKIEEGPSAQLGGGIGYSETYKFQLNASYSDANFLGTGQRVAIELNGGAFSKVYSIQETNPYTTVDNLQRTISLTYRDVTQFVSSSSNFSSKTLSVGPTWAYPLTEFQFIRFGAVFESSQLLTSSVGSALQAQQWVQDNGHPYSRIGHDDASNNEYVFYGTNFKDVELVLGWDWDTRNRTLFADRGSRFSASVTSTTPGADVEYYIANATFVHYVPLWKGFSFVTNTGVDYGEPFGHTTAIPPYRQFFGGGPDNVRGFRESRLGPADQFGNPYGGNMRITSQNELIFPMPAKWRSSARVSAFFDMGGVYETGNKITFYGPDGVTPESYRLTEWSDIRRSVGVAVQWLAPLGLFRFSLGVPLNAQHGDGITKWGDQTEVFQFSIGQAF
jgi:outer membrane protein insertion porin family